MSNYMLPSSIPVNIVNGRLIHFIVKSYGLFMNTIGKKFSYFSDLSWCQFGIVMIHSFMGVKPKLPSLPTVIPIRTPLKILNSVISFLAVNMINSFKILGIKNKSLGDQSMNKMFARVLSSVKHQTFISAIINKYLQLFVLSVASYKARFISRIKFLVSFNWFHVLMVYPRYILVN